MSPPDTRIYLASRSPRRRELLHQVGVRFDVLAFRAGVRADAEVDESVLPGEAPEVYVARVACAKARHGLQLVQERRLPSRLILAADTTLDLDGHVVGKPHDSADAEAILYRLSGRSHRVLTAVALAQGQRLEHVVNVSTVWFRKLETEEIRRYARSGEPLDKAGAYAIQGQAAQFIERVDGSPSGIIGLPLCDTALLLRRFGYPV